MVGIWLSILSFFDIKNKKLLQKDIYYDRKRLKILGDNARQIIHEKYTKENVMKLWNSVL